jgi:hypothetical protein
MPSLSPAEDLTMRDATSVPVRTDGQRRRQFPRKTRLSMILVAGLSIFRRSWGVLRGPARLRWL